jgi:hypothetical protein
MVSLYKDFIAMKSLAFIFAARGENKIKSVVSGGVYIGNETSRAGKR